MASMRLFFWSGFRTFDLPFSDVKAIDFLRMEWPEMNVGPCW